MGFNAGITSLQDPDPTDKSDLLSASPPLVEGRMGRTNFRFVDEGRVVRKLETAPASWIWPPSLDSGIGRGILPRQCFRRLSWINCSLTENTEQILCQWELLLLRDRHGERHKLWKNKDQPCHSWYLKITLCSFTCSSLCFLTVIGNCVLIFQKGFCRLKSLIFVKYSCKLSKEQEKCLEKNPSGAGFDWYSFHKADTRHLGIWLMQNIKITALLMKTYKGLQQQSHEGPSHAPAHLETSSLMMAICSSDRTE